jgi:ABC-type Na+ transport system ATPase subunit NatA
MNCDEVLLMRSGQIIASGTADALVRGAGTKNLEEAFLYYIGTAQQEAQS